MPVIITIDVLAKLKERGYSSYKLRKENLLSESTLQKLREFQGWKDDKGLTWSSITRICELLDCQPADFMAYKPNSVKNRSNT